MAAPTLDAALLTGDIRHVFESQKALADRALAQVDDASFFARQPGEVDPLAVTVKHVGGNLRSRWRDFLTTDGEKPDRRRDSEFELGRDDDRATLMALWEAGWSELFETFDALRPEDWAKRITIRGEPHTVSQAALRSLAHTSYHVGQIVQLSKRAVGECWQTLSIPRGGSESFRQAPAPYLDASDDDR